MCRRVITTTLLLLVLAAIIFLSVQSSDVSGKIDAFYMKHFPIWMVFPPVSLFGHAVTMREAAHTYEYFALGMIAMVCFVKKERCPWRALYAWLFCVVTSNVDQFSKLFIPGREYAATDLFYDAVGYTAGVLLMFFLGFVFWRVKRRIEK